MRGKDKSVTWQQIYITIVIIIMGPNLYVHYIYFITLIMNHCMSFTCGNKEERGV